MISRAWPHKAQRSARGWRRSAAALLMGARRNCRPQPGRRPVLPARRRAVRRVSSSAWRACAIDGALSALALSTVLGIAPLLIARGGWARRSGRPTGGRCVGLAVVSQLIGQGLMVYAIGHLSPLSSASPCCCSRSSPRRSAGSCTTNASALPDVAAHAGRGRAGAGAPSGPCSRRRACTRCAEGHKVEP